MLRRLVELLKPACRHARLGWPTRRRDELIAFQRCFECGAQRIYSMYPQMEIGPWRR